MLIETLPAAAPPAAVPGRPSSFAIEVPDALLGRARAGERAAFEQVYRRFERPVFTLALRICGDRDAAADVLQETMLKVIARIGGFRGRDGSPVWGGVIRKGAGVGNGVLDSVRLAGRGPIKKKK